MPKVSFAGAEAPMDMPAEVPAEAGMDAGIQSGLQQILASQDINEIHAIAQGLLGGSAEPEGESLEAGLDAILNKG